jgi:hypothetical protein
MFLHVDTLQSPICRAHYVHMVKVKLSPQQAVKAHKIVKRRGSHIFQKIGSQIVVRFSALRAGRLYPKEDSSY